MGCDQMILTFDAYPPQHHRSIGWFFQTHTENEHGKTRRKKKAETTI